MKILYMLLLFSMPVCTVILQAYQEEELNMSVSRYSVFEQEQEGIKVFVLRDKESGCEAMIAPGLGNNCFSYSFNVNGEKIDIIESPPNLSILKGRSSGFGNPILFPFPNRIREGKFSFEGRDFQFDTPVPGANSIHGVVLNRHWKVEAAEANETEGARLASSINSSDFPDILRQFPFPFRVLVTYILKDGVLTMLTRMENSGKDNMPMGFGIHPYFCAPLSKSTDPKDCLIKVPAKKYWELKDFLPTGKIFEASGKYNLRDGVPISDIRFDDVFTDLILTDGLSRCVIEDKKANMRMILESDAIFREMVIYTPPNRPSVCFEPYTCPTDAINLYQQGIESGIIVLKPGESLSATVKIIFQH
ncbi:aldose 1-epimerase [Candidatus Poribacteria bacterium]|nr:aldose 1-epimerase [Candidatus Poribacteria bacterium]